MREASYYIKQEDSVKCVLCPRDCVLKNGEVGFCKVRKNENGKLYSLVYARPVAVHVDPIEKKPLFHFLPGSKTFSIGTAGCNLRCQHCQNWNISQAKPSDFSDRVLEPKEVVKQAIEQGCKSIAYTYNEPTIFFEYMIETAKLAKKKGLKNVAVTNGFIHQEPLKELCKYLDAVNVDLKSFSKQFYGKVTAAWLEPVLDTIKTLKEKGVWLEITNLIIPSVNDSDITIKEMCEWLKENVGVDVPIHFSAFHPDYKFQDYPPTSIESLTNARDIAKNLGLNYVFVGNVFTNGLENTTCPNCNKLLIDRRGFQILENNMFKNTCRFCNKIIMGVF
jgi:pyruvate formate lyase activating enzyme